MEYTARPATESDYDLRCDFDMGGTWCESCGNDELECELPRGHSGPHYARDSHHWSDVYEQQESATP